MYFKVTIGKALPKKAQVIIRHTTHQRADNSRNLAICQFFQNGQKSTFWKGQISQEQAKK